MVSSQEVNCRQPNLTLSVADLKVRIRNILITQKQPCSSSKTFLPSLKRLNIFIILTPAKKKEGGFSIETLSIPAISYLLLGAHALVVYVYAFFTRVFVIYLFLIYI